MKGFSIHLPIAGRKNSFTKVALGMAFLVLLMAQPVFASNPNPGVFPPNSKPYGKTINEWTAEWWKYVLSFPADTNPLADATGAHCAQGQSGPVFFLVGTTGGPAVRNKCVVPAGKAILFPIINVISAVPEDSSNAQDLIDLVTWYEGQVDRTEARIDGVDLQDVLATYRFPSPIFSFDGATPGIFSPAYEGHRDIGFSDGWWVMLKPLTPGKHTIHFLGHQLVPDYGVDFTTEVSYRITVVKKGKR
jgi:hypothetical protein